jgi:phosphoribosyl-ATP pyrophosphohydrolase/phosphoribosyl-AMP cyclohydrolase
MSDPVEMKWDSRGLMPAVVVDASTGALRMLAWMNNEAFRLTRETGFAHFYSRSRSCLWKKGETSGNTLAVCDIRIDCDADTVLLVAEPHGPSCHTGKTSCFYRSLRGDEIAEDDGPGGARAAIVDRLHAILEDRRQNADAGASYTRSLLDAGMPKILAKIAEEHAELADELPDGTREAVIHETADLLFHVLVGLVARNISTAEIWRELERRFGVSGHEEKASRAK